MRNRWWIVLLACALSCGCVQTVPEKEVPPPTAAGPAVPGFSLLSPLGDRVALEPGSRPGEVTLVSFWSPSWDADHAFQESLLRELLDRYGNEKLRVVVIAYDEKPETIRDYLRQNPVPFEVAIGDEAIPEAYHLEAIPTTVLVAPDGHEAARWQGHQKAEALKGALEPFLGAKSGN